jgi:hypothetical protein
MDWAEECADIPLADLPNENPESTAGGKGKGGKNDRQKSGSRGGGGGGGGKVAGHDMKFWATVRMAHFVLQNYPAYRHWSFLPFDSSC